LNLTVTNPQLRVFPPSRTVIHGDAFSWLAKTIASPQSSIMTSLPDVSELSELGFSGWRAWFIDTVALLLHWLPDDGLAIFYQSDIRYNDVWIDKSFLVQLGAEKASAHLVWHKIMCRKPPGTIGIGRPSYAHMLCFSKAKRPMPLRPGPDVLANEGEKTWPRAIGREAAKLAMRFLSEESSTQVVVDPFCGEGTVLAAANLFGMAAVGVERSRKRCEESQRLVFNCVSH
jgi:hypothetical protein